jgi:hypothetical protein
MLDAVRAALEATRSSLKTYEDRVANPLKEKTNTPWSYWNEEKDSFRAWLAEATWKPYIELKVKKQEEKALKEKEKAERENKKNLEHSIERCRNLIKYFEEVERALIDHGAKTWAELNPTAAAAQEALMKNTVPLQTLGTFPSSIIENPALASESADFLAENYKTPSVPLRFYIFSSACAYGWSTEPAPVHTLPLYEELFEACWKGNNERIKELCLPPKTGKRNKDTEYIQIICEVYFHSSIVSPPCLDDKVREEISTFKEYPSQVQNISSGTSIEWFIRTAL